MKIDRLIGVVVAVSGLGFVAVGARAQATEGVMPVPVGAVRLDADAYARGEDWRTDPSGERARSDIWGAVQLATGWTERAELRAAWDAYRREESGGAEVQGTGDVLLSAKIHLAGDEAAGLA